MAISFTFIISKPLTKKCYKEKIYMKNLARHALWR